MIKFALDNKDFDSCRADVPKTKITLEIMKTDKDDYTIFIHEGDFVAEMGVYTKSELKIIWEMLTTKK
jgi:hypothetical protein